MYGKQAIIQLNPIKTGTENGKLLFNQCYTSVAMFTLKISVISYWFC